MQPITQPSLDPNLNDIRHLRAEQTLDGLIDCFGPSILYRGTTRAFPDTSVPARNSTTIRTYLVRILPPLLQKHLFSLEKRVFGGDSDDSLDDSPGTKAAH